MAMCLKSIRLTATGDEGRLGDEETGDRRRGDEFYVITSYSRRPVSRPSVSRPLSPVAPSLHQRLFHARSYFAVDRLRDQSDPVHQLLKLVAQQ